MGLGPHPSARLTAAQLAAVAALISDCARSTAEAALLLLTAMAALLSRRCAIPPPRCFPALSLRYALNGETPNPQEEEEQIRSASARLHPSRTRWRRSALARLHPWSLAHAPAAACMGKTPFLAYAPAAVCVGKTPSLAYAPAAARMGRPRGEGWFVSKFGLFC